MKRVQKLAYGQLGKILQHHQKNTEKKLGQPKPETAGAEDSITKQSN